MDLRFSGQDEPIGTTAAHPFWSVTRQRFVPAGELYVGEEVVALDGQTFRLTSITPRAGPEPVFNLEIANQHTFFVSKNGLLVHNAKKCAPLSSRVTKGTKAPDKPANIKRSNAKDPDRTHVVYQVKDPTNGKTYTGRASGYGTKEQVLEKRFSSHHRGYDTGNIKRSFEVDSYEEARGLEELLHRSAKKAGRAAEQINPIDPRNKNITTYLNAAQSIFR